VHRRGTVPCRPPAAAVRTTSGMGPPSDRYDRRGKKKKEARQRCTITRTWGGRRPPSYALAGGASVRGRGGRLPRLDLEGLRVAVVFGPHGQSQQRVLHLRQPRKWEAQTLKLLHVLHDQRQQPPLVEVDQLPRATRRGQRGETLADRRRVHLSRWPSRARTSVPGRRSELPSWVNVRSVRYRPRYGSAGGSAWGMHQR
jgi:hypothetical protein